MVSFGNHFLLLVMKSSFHIAKYREVYYNIIIKLIKVKLWNSTKAL